MYQPTPFADKRLHRRRTELKPRCPKEGSKLPSFPLTQNQRPLHLGFACWGHWTSRGKQQSWSATCFTDFLFHILNAELVPMTTLSMFMAGTWHEHGRHSPEPLWPSASVRCPQRDAGEAFLPGGHLFLLKCKVLREAAERMYPHGLWKISETLTSK